MLMHVSAYAAEITWVRSVPSIVSPQMKAASDNYVNVDKSVIMLASVAVAVIVFASCMLTFMADSVSA